MCARSSAHRNGVLAVRSALRARRNNTSPDATTTIPCALLLSGWPSSTGAMAIHWPAGVCNANAERRKVGKLLRAEGWPVNHKKVERLWREEGLQLPHRHKRRKRLYHHDASVIRLRPKYPNYVWAIDFVHDKLSNGRPYKMLTVLDEYTREALCVAVGARMGAADVLESLYPLLLKRGRPEYIRSDNGPEFSAAPFQDWVRRVGIQTIRIYPGSPWENGYNERFNGTLRREVLNAEWFATTRQAQAVIDTWLRQYNHVRPHHALGMRAPVPETVLEKP